MKVDLNKESAKILFFFKIERERIPLVKNTALQDCAKIIKPGLEPLSVHKMRKFFQLIINFPDASRIFVGLSQDLDLSTRRD